MSDSVCRKFFSHSSKNCFRSSCPAVRKTSKTNRVVLLMGYCIPCGNTKVESSCQNFRWNQGWKSSAPGDGYFTQGLCRIFATTFFSLKRSRYHWLQFTRPLCWPLFSWSLNLYFRNTGFEGENPFFPWQIRSVFNEWTNEFSGRPFFSNGTDGAKPCTALLSNNSIFSYEIPVFLKERWLIQCKNS